MQSDLRSKARGCLLGLAVGDALGTPTEGKTLQFIAGHWGKVTDFLGEGQTGSDDTEYALFNARLLLSHGMRLDAFTIADAWMKEIVSSANGFHGAGFSEMMAIRNLREGLRPPQSGMHAHAWSDGLAMRVAPFGIVAAGRPSLAARLAEIDGSVSHSGEGIFGGQAVAAAVAAALGGASAAEIVDAARSVIPVDSWTRRGIDRAAAIAARHADVWSALEPLYRDLVCPSYFWPDLAPEAVPLAMGIFLSSRGRFADAVLGGVNIGRDSDTIAAIAGSLAGAQLGEDSIPSAWVRRVTTARGSCLGVVAGMDLGQTADQLVDLAHAGENLS